MSTPKHIQEAVFEVITKLEVADTIDSAHVDYKRMEGQKKSTNYFRIRIGQYRLGLEYIKPNIMLITIMIRGDIYKSFPPK
ncbi:type II toxin-antitoxin system RelE/ParE family toxin [Dyadobacter sp. NIV53]|uniref:type II toxin-antitoxin system RelE family toxin n=1 Tax=Dyadobacter sp. NIV53 TaxID=2861765 RepID=UPI001C867744|nr:hypothetical protein [Dyadobacter sp. NIV53]